MSQEKPRRSYRPAKAERYYYRTFEIIKSDRPNDNNRWHAFKAAPGGEAHGFYPTLGIAMKGIDWVCKRAER